jgi:ubiquinone/menaquinone biosynthesis C-methylase UbiE
MVNRTLNPQKGETFGVKDNCEITSMGHHELVGIINMNVLQNLGNLLGKKYDGIYSPLYKQSEINNHIHDQFTVKAQEYAKKYQNIDYWEYLLREAFNHAKIKEFEKKIILDLGSGAGNTTLPLLEIFNNSIIIATDLSVELLYILQNHLKKFDVKNNSYKLIQCDIHELNKMFKNNSFDIVVGGAILHHLYDPKKVLKQCYYALNAEGIASFFEPFENGNMLLSLLYQFIISQNELEKEKLPDSVINIFKQLVNDFKIRSNINKNSDIFKLLDDKWIFKRNYFEDISKDIGFKSCQIRPLTTDFKKYFEKQSLTYLRLGIGFEYDKLPLWSREIIKLADVTFSEEMKKDLLTEGCIILKK